MWCVSDDAHILSQSNILRIIIIVFKFLPCDTKLLCPCTCSVILLKQTLWIVANHARCKYLARASYKKTSPPGLRIKAHASQSDNNYNYVFRCECVIKMYCFGVKDNFCLILSAATLAGLNVSLFANHACKREKCITYKVFNCYLNLWNIFYSSLLCTTQHCTWHLYYFF